MWTDERTIHADKRKIEQKVGGYRRGPHRLNPDIGVVRYFHRAHTEETMRVKIEKNHGGTPETKENSTVGNPLYEDVQRGPSLTEIRRSRDV